MPMLQWLPEALITALDELERVYAQAKADPEFHKELARLNQQYVGRPSPLTVQTIRFPITAIASILHRVSGVIVGFLGYVIAFILSVWIVFDIYFKGRNSKKRYVPEDSAGSGRGQYCFVRGVSPPPAQTVSSQCRKRQGQRL